MPAVKGRWAEGGRSACFEKASWPFSFGEFCWKKAKKGRRPTDWLRRRLLSLPSGVSLLRLPALSKLLYLFCQTREGTLFESEEKLWREDRVDGQRKQLILQGKRQKKTGQFQETKLRNSKGRKSSLCLQDLWNRTKLLCLSKPTSFLGAPSSLERASVWKTLRLLRAPLKFSCET